MLAAASFGVAWSAGSKFAPADEYFGRLKLSYLGINLTFKDQAAYATPHSTDPGIVNKLVFAEEALQAWQTKYPKDAQLARSYFLAQETYKKIWIKEYQDKAWDYMQLILKTYPNTFFSKTVYAGLGVGYTEHFYAVALPCVDPENPQQPQPTPQPFLTPAAKSSERGTRKYDIIDVACFTPTPEPTATPSPSPVPVAPLPPAALPRAMTPVPASPGAITPLPASPGAITPLPASPGATVTATAAPAAVTPAPVSPAVTSPAPSASGRS